MPPDNIQIITADAMITMEQNAPTNTDMRTHFGEPAGVVIAIDPATNTSTILAAGSLTNIQPRYHSAPHTHIPGFMIPGLINAHTHLELGYQPRDPAASVPVQFTNWVGSMMSRHPAVEHADALITQAIKDGVKSSVGGGVTTIADISRHSVLTRSILKNENIRAVSFGEVMGLGKMRHRHGDLIIGGAKKTHATPKLTVGLSPHAPYTVEGPTLNATVARALADHLPLTMHLAELEEEADFLRNLSGALGYTWDVMIRLGTLDESIPPHPTGPISWAKRWGLLDAAKKVPVILAHVNYCTDEELRLLAASLVSIAYCPRTREYFGHETIRPHRYRDMLAAGINVCLGTDSLASNPDLCLAREAATLMHRDNLHPLLTLDMITRRGAIALGMANKIGTLAPGKRADFTILPLPEKLPLGTLADRKSTIGAALELTLAPTWSATATWIDGTRAL